MIKVFRRDYLFFIIFGLSLVVAGALFLPLSVGFKKINQVKIEQIAADAEKGIKQEAEYLLKQSRELDESRVFDRLLSERDSAGLISVSVEEARKRGVGGILVADKDGLVLSRTRAISQRGDFIFNNTYFGRNILELGESEGVDKGATHPIIFYGGVLMRRDEKPFGAIVSANILDDEYAKRFSEKYLPAGTDMAFFSKEKGLLGTSFEAEDEKRLIEIYFSSGSEFNEKGGAQIKVAVNGGEYFARNILFENGYGSSGNLILFVPHNHGREAFILALFAVFIFISVSFVAFRFDAHRHNSPFLILLITAGAVFVFIFSFYASKTILDGEHIRLSKPPYVIYNSTMEINPDSATLNLDFEHIVSVDVLTGGESINAVEAVIKYDPLATRIEEIRTTNSFCHQDFFIEREIDNKKGEARIVCGLPTPGFNGLKGNVAELVLQPLKPGVIELGFGDETSVFANDGLGTNVLRNTTGASFAVANGDVMDGFDGGEVFVFSPTHPNATRWYNLRSAIFAWSGRDSYQYGYVFNQSPDTMPDEEELTSKTSANLTADEDGIHYFHLLSKSGADEPRVSRYKVRIDSTPPEKPAIKASAVTVGVGEVVRFEFSSKDELSGIQPTFYVKLRDDGVFLPAGSQLFVAFPEKGKQKITVRVFDRANNYNESSITLTVR